MPASSPFYFISFYSLVHSAPITQPVPLPPPTLTLQPLYFPQINAWLTLEFPSSLDLNDTFSVRPSVQNYQKLHQPSSSPVLFVLYQPLSTFWFIYLVFPYPHSTQNLCFIRIGIFVFLLHLVLCRWLINISAYMTSLYLKWITNKVLSYCTGNSA